MERHGLGIGIGMARKEKEMEGMERQGKTQYHNSRKGIAWKCKARKCKERHGMA
jgi:hypothetical protein